jgi:hypothetical protein
MGALISEDEAVAALGLDAPIYETAARLHLPCVQIAGKLFVEARDLPRWREALASEQARR